MRFMIVGAGATGGYFGAKLAAAGQDVTFLVRPAHAQRLQQAGLSVLSAAGDLHISPKTILRDGLAAPFDYVLLAVKAHRLAEVLEDFAPAVGPQTMILPLLNGMHHLDMLQDRFGGSAVLGGVCHIGATLDEEGRILHLGAAQGIDFGELDGTLSPRVNQLCAALQQGGFDVHLSTNILAGMWEKWVGLAALAMVTCLLRGSVGEVNQTPWGGMLAAQGLQECAAIAAAQGFAQTQAHLDKLLGNLTQAQSTQTCSLYRDLLHGAPVEVEHVLSDLWRRGALHAVSAPLLAATAAQLCIHNHRLAAGG